MRIDVLTLFPDMFSALDHSIIKRARTAGHLEINIVNFRDFSANKHKQVDDTPYGGGPGMILMAQPIVDCIESLDPERKARRIFLTPSADVLKHKTVIQIAKHDHIILLCGHYEGVDRRVVELCIDQEVSIGEYVLTGGEIPAMVLIDAVARHIPGVINADSLVNESYTNGNTHEHHQYTRPREYRGLVVPQVLLDGNHAEIEKWRKK